MLCTQCKSSFSPFELYNGLCGQCSNQLLVDAVDALQHLFNAALQMNGCYPLPYPPSDYWKRDAFDRAKAVLDKEPKPAIATQLADSLRRERELQSALADMAVAIDRVSVAQGTVQPFLDVFKKHASTIAGAQFARANKLC